MDAHKPELHFSPERGILEAPAGILKDGDTWHLFYQYRPTKEEPSRWGHAYSEQAPFEWLDCDDALAPAGGEVGLRAGSVTAVDGTISLYFTSLTSVGTSISLATYTAWGDTCEVSDEFGAIDPAVQRRGVIMADAQGLKRFRSPCVVPDWADERGEDHAGYLMLAVTGNAEAPALVISRSQDGVVWQCEGPLEFEGDPGFAAQGSALPPVVSPRIIRLRDEVDGEVYDILFVTLERGEREYSGYIVGTLEGTTFRVTTGFRLLDHGHDFTRPRNTNYTPGTRSREDRYAHAHVIGLLNGFGRADNPESHQTYAAAGWANALSLPRHLTLEDGIIYQTPPKGLVDAVSDSRAARMWTGLLEVPEGSSLTVTLLDAQGEPAAVITHSGTELTFDRSMGQAFDRIFAQDTSAKAELADADSDSLTIIVDGSTVEVFADSGLVTMSSRVFFEGGCSGFHVETSGDAEVIKTFERSGS